MAKETGNVVDTKGQPVQGEETGNQEVKQEKLGKRILKRAAKELLYFVVGAAAVGAVWCVSSRKEKASGTGASEETAETNDSSVPEESSAE